MGRSIVWCACSEVGGNFEADGRIDSLCSSIQRFKNSKIQGCF
ncbi:hypothetical protein KAOT1_14132 [Kordia algicida OT-1]|uniref:Uncharacterized protein n=1 Tax=Kordia algicida OT-1 TaxID=391587 RepID=A9DKN2_9FLAO|nr:hypothetical protein KAOT1_14132 [Kordia algicida OT-1]